MLKVKFRINAFVLILFLFFWVSLAEAASSKVHGFVGHSSVSPAGNVSVKLTDGESGRVIDIV